jgi:YegS/Rv2252/BmrU family lipid kinase
VLLALNGRARRGRIARETALAALRGRGYEVLVPDIRRPADMTAVMEAHRGRVDVVAVGGGDGTLVSAIPGVRALDVPLAILPLGTINELARTLGIPLDVEAACALIDEGVPRRIDVAHANGFWFFNEASIGLSTHVAREQTGELKSRWGMLAIPIATLRAWRNLRPYQLTVESVHGTRTFHTVQLTIANSYRFGGVVENPDAAIDDGMLDLYAIDVQHWWDVFPVLRAVGRRNFPAARNVETLRSPWFTVRGRHAHRVFADGEHATLTPAEFRVVPGALAVLVPQ